MLIKYSMVIKVLRDIYLFKKKEFIVYLIINK